MCIQPLCLNKYGVTHKGPGHEFTSITQIYTCEVGIFCDIMLFSHNAQYTLKCGALGDEA